MPGSESVTPYFELYNPIGTTARSSRNTGWPHAFDDRNICVTYFLLDRRADVILPQVALFKRIRNRDAADAGTGAMKDLGCPVFAENLRLDGRRNDVKSSAQMYSKARASSKVPVLRTRSCPANCRVRQGMFVSVRRQVVRRPDANLYLSVVVFFERAFF
jgi:hypothetical protein